MGNSIISVVISICILHLCQCTLPGVGFNTHVREDGLSSLTSTGTSLRVTQGEPFATLGEEYFGGPKGIEVPVNQVKKKLPVSSRR